MGERLREAPGEVREPNQDEFCNHREVFGLM